MLHVPLRSCRVALRHVVARVRFVVYVAKQVLHFQSWVLTRISRAHLIVHLKPLLRFMHGRDTLCTTHALKVTASHQIRIHIRDLALISSCLNLHLP